MTDQQHTAHITATVRWLMANDPDPDGPELEIGEMIKLVTGAQS